MDRKVFLKTVSPLLIIPFLPLSFWAGCNKTNDKADLKEVIGKSENEIFKKHNGKLIGNSFYHFIEETEKDTQLLKFHSISKSIFYSIQNGVVERISLILSKKQISDFKNHLINKKLGTLIKTIKNEWGTSEQYQIQNEKFVIYMCTDNMEEGNQIVVESKDFKHHLLI